VKLKRRLNPEIQRKLDDAFFVGRLVTEDELALTPNFYEPVEYQGELQDYIQFHIKCLSPIPHELSKQFFYSNDIFTGSTASDNNYEKFREWIRIDYLPHVEVKEKIFECFQDKLIVFQLSCYNDYINVELVQVENIQPAAGGYTPIPGPQLRLDETKSDFENKLSGDRRPIVLKYYPSLFELPEFIYYQGTLYHVALKTNLNATTYSQEEGVDVLYLEHMEGVFSNMVDARVDDLLYFVQTDALKTLKARFEQEANSLSRKLTVGETATQPGTADVVQGDYSDAALTSRYVFNESEWHFLNLLKTNARKKALFFQDEDLIAFHISVKTNMLSIIGGMSGTGKSQLAQLYGETMGLTYGKELLLIPVSPSYHEPNDVLGYYNPTTGIYHESETGLVRLLLEAEAHPERMYMVVFDEMNLSQVEHWFSPFISLLEVDPDKRYLTLFHADSRFHDEMYKPKVKIGDNVIFVGTVNFDDTTKEFSDRLLDRTNVIRPSKLTFREAYKIVSTFDDTSKFQTMEVSAKMFREEWVSGTPSLNSLTEAELTFLDELHTLLNNDDSQKGVSFRVVLGIAGYLSNIPVNPDGLLMISRGQAFDRQVEQRILTKIKGFESFVTPLVGSYSGDEYIEGDIMKLIRSELGQKVSTFERSANALKRKAKELMLYGFAH